MGPMRKNHHLSNEKRASPWLFLPDAWSRAFFSVTTSHRHGVFLCFFLIQGAFLWDGLGRDVDVHLHLRHIYDTTSRMGWGGMLTSTCTYVLSMILRHGWVGVGCEGSTKLAA